jgi:predicted RNA binding protein YcfA (HicA-like mRNA interferase family)
VKTLKFREVIKILTDHGFSEDRTKGSHAQFKAVINGQTRTVTVQINHLSDTVAPGTLKSIIRTSGLPKSAFEK